MNRRNISLFFSLKVLIAVLLFLIPLGLTIASTDQPDNIEVKQQLSTAESTTNVGYEPIEVVSMRTSLSKTYDNGDGSYKAVLYINPIHYQDPSGTWVESDESEQTQQPTQSTRSSSREVDTLQPGPTDGKDTMISSDNNADMNIGADQEFWFTGEQNTVNFLKFRLLLEFNVASLGIPAGADINNAELMLNYFASQDINQQNAGASTQMSMTAYPLSRSWVEGSGTTSGVTQDGATWNDYDGSSSWSSAGGDYSSSYSGTGQTPTSFGWTSIDVNTIVDAWIDGTISNYGFLVLSNTNHDYLKKFRTSDYSGTTERPKLVINYVSNKAPRLNNPPQYNRYDMNEDQGVTYFDLDGTERPSTGLFTDDDAGDTLVFYLWAGTDWVGVAGGAFDGDYLTAEIKVNGTMEITPKKNKHGSEEVILNATDSEGASKEYILTIRLLPVNDPPKINDTTNWNYDKPAPMVDAGIITCDEDTWVNFTVTAWDPIEPEDNAFLEFSVNSTSEYAPFFTVDKNTGIVRFYPLNQDVGTYYLKILVDDGNDENNIAEFPFTLEIVNVNDVPEFRAVQIEDYDYSIPEGAEEYKLTESATEDETFVFWVVMEDEDFDLVDYEEQLKFTITPSSTFEVDTFATFPDQVRITFNPTNDDVGLASAFLRVEDKDKADNTLELKIEVLNVNDAPHFVRFHYKTQEKDVDSTELDLEKLGSGYKATEYIPYVFKLEGLDPDEGDTIKFDASIMGRDEIDSNKMFNIEDIPNKPNTKQFTITPDQKAGREGELSINATLSDNNKATSWVIIKIPVDNTNDPPVQPLINIEIVDTDRKTRQKENLTIKFEANYTSDIKYPDPDGSGDLTYTWDFGDNSDFEYGQFIDHKFPDSGEYTITLTVTDTDGLSNTSTKKVEVIKPKAEESGDDSDGAGAVLGEVAGIPLLFIIILIIVIVVLLVLFMVMRSRQKKKEEEEAAARAQAEAQAQQQAQMAQMQMAQAYPMGMGGAGGAGAGMYQDPNMMAQYQAYQDQYQQLMMQQYPEQYQQQMAAQEQQQFGYDQAGAGVDSGTGTGMQEQGYAPTPTTPMTSQPMQEATMAGGAGADEMGLPPSPATTEQPQMLPPAEPGQVQEQEQEIPDSPYANAETQTLEDEMGKDAEIAEIPIEPEAEAAPQPEVTPDTETPTEPVSEGTAEVTDSEVSEPTPTPTPTPTPVPKVAETGKAEGAGETEGGRAGENGNTCKNCGASVKEGWFLCPKCKQPLI